MATAYTITGVRFFETIVPVTYLSDVGLKHYGYMVTRAVQRVARRALQEEHPLPCPELYHRRANLSRALKLGWIDAGEFTLGEGGPLCTGVSKPFPMHGWDELFVVIAVPVEDCTIFGEDWKAGEVILASAGEAPAPVYMCGEWPKEVMDTVKAEVMAFPLPWMLIAVAGTFSVIALAVVIRR